MVYNDSKLSSKWKLLDLGEIIKIQLVSMEKKKIMRHLFDKTHRSIIAMMDTIDDEDEDHDLKQIKRKTVIGGVVFRPFPERNFAEVVFLAISPNFNSKGYGARLMNHLKEYVKKMGIYNLVTFADNTAIGYFRKQGFDFVVNDKENRNKDNEQIDDDIDRSYGCKRLNFEEIYHQKEQYGYIRGYIRATLMHTRLIKDVNYCKLNEHLMKNRILLMSRLENVTKSMKKRDGLTVFNNTNVKKIDIMKIPGVKESGCKEMDITNTSSLLFSPRHPGYIFQTREQIKRILKKLHKHSHAYIFAEPVNKALAPNYYQVIKNPMDLSTMKRKYDRHEYITVNQFKEDFKLMIKNCKIYNQSKNIFYKCAVEFEKYFEELMKEELKKKRLT